MDSSRGTVTRNNARQGTCSSSGSNIVFDSEQTNTIEITTPSMVDNYRRKPLGKISRRGSFPADGANSAGRAAQAPTAWDSVPKAQVTQMKPPGITAPGHWAGTECGAAGSPQGSGAAVATWSYHVPRFDYAKKRAPMWSAESCGNRWSASNGLRPKRRWRVHKTATDLHTLLGSASFRASCCQERHVGSLNALSHKLPQNDRGSGFSQLMIELALQRGWVFALQNMG